MSKKALISVSNKEGVVEFAEFLSNQGYSLLSTGSTAKLLKEKGLDVEFVEEYTGFPEMLDGRVKTLHPKIHGGILFIRNNKAHEKTVKEFNIDPIDIVVVNLYPFEETAVKTDDVDILIENIDIGGPSMLRAAAKNHKSVLVVCDPNDYKNIMDSFENIDENTRKHYALKAFAHTAYYDSLIVEKLGLSQYDKTGIAVKKVLPLRYGENPQQKAAFFKDPLKKGIADAKQLNGKELSYNNILDIDVAYRIMSEFKDTVCAIIKHNTPCGVAKGSDIVEAYKKALSCDPISAFGGIIGINSTIDEALASEITKRFYEVVVAYGYTKNALEILRKKKNLRVIAVDKIDNLTFKEIRSVVGGYLVQDNDAPMKFEYEVVTKTKPTKEQIEDLAFAFKVSKFVKSNAIVYAKDGKTLAIGGGQTSRIDSAKFAAQKAKELNINLDGCVMASDGFFPFKDSVEFAHSQKVAAIVEPGGSIRDNEVIEAADQFEIPLLFTHMRHFRH